VGYFICTQLIFSSIVVINIHSDSSEARMKPLVDKVHQEAILFQAFR